MRIVPALVCIAVLGALHYYVVLAVILLAIVWTLVLPLPFNEFKKYDVDIEYYPLATRQIYQWLSGKIEQQVSLNQ